MDEIAYMWRGDFSNEEVNELHAESFEHRVFSASEWDWLALCERHSLGWVTARLDGRLVGFVNLPWDGLVHAWIQDLMVSSAARRQGIGARLVQVAREGAKSAGCEWLHVDFEDHLRPFYYGVAGFAPTNGGLIDLTRLD